MQHNVLRSFKEPLGPTQRWQLSFVKNQGSKPQPEPVYDAEHSLTSWGFTSELGLGYLAPHLNTS